MKLVTKCIWFGILFFFVGQLLGCATLTESQKLERSLDREIAQIAWDKFRQTCAARNGHIYVRNGEYRSNPRRPPSRHATYRCVSRAELEAIIRGTMW